MDRIKVGEKGHGKMFLFFIDELSFLFFMFGGSEKSRFDGPEQNRSQ